MSDHTLLVPFLNDHPAYAHGVEFGMLVVKMLSPLMQEIEDYFTIENQEQITLTANRLGWQVTEMQESVKGWFWCRLEKKS